MIEKIITQFECKVLNIQNTFKNGLIHGDANEQNILVEIKNGKWKIKAILDFGDSHIGCYLYELAIAITYMMLVAKDVNVGGYVLAGYLKHMNISEREYLLLKVAKLYTESLKYLKSSTKTCDRTKNSLMIQNQCQGQFSFVMCTDIFNIRF